MTGVSGSRGSGASPGTATSRRPLRNRGWRAAPATGYPGHAERLLRFRPQRRTATRSAAPAAATEHDRSQTHPAPARAGLATATSRVSTADFADACSPGRGALAASRAGHTPVPGELVPGLITRARTSRGYAPFWIAFGGHDGCSLRANPDRSHGFRTTGIEEKLVVVRGQRPGFRSRPGAIGTAAHQVGWSAVCDRLHAQLRSEPARKTTGSDRIADRCAWLPVVERVGADGAGLQTRPRPESRRRSGAGFASVRERTGKSG
jgi:hypothetical protein